MVRGGEGNFRGGGILLSNRSNSAVFILSPLLLMGIQLEQDFAPLIFPLRVDLHFQRDVCHAGKQT